MSIDIKAIQDRIAKRNAEVKRVNAIKPAPQVMTTQKVALTPNPAPAGMEMESMDLGFNLNEPRAFDNFPAGEYTAKIVNAEFKFTSMHKPMVTLQFQILDGEHINKYHWSNNVLKTKDNKDNNVAINRVQDEILLVTGEEWTESTVPALKSHLSQMINKVVVIKVVHKSVKEKVFISTYINEVKETV